MATMSVSNLGNVYYYYIKWEHIITEVTTRAVSPAVTTNASPLNMPANPCAEKCWYNIYKQRARFKSGAHLETRHANTCRGAVIPSSRNNNGNSSWAGQLANQVFSASPMNANQRPASELKLASELAGMLNAMTARSKFVLAFLMNAITAATVKHTVGGVSDRALAPATTVQRCLFPTAVPFEGVKATPCGRVEAYPGE